MIGLWHERFTMRELEITFLGTGTSHGVPMIGCQCRVCHSSDPRDKRLRASIQVRSADRTIQVDTTPDFRTQCLREGLTHIDDVIYTHSHTDHILGFDDLRRFCDLQDMVMPIHASEATLKDLQRVFQYAFGDPTPPRNYIRPQAVTITGPFVLGDVEIHPVDLPHGRMTTTGLIFWRGGRKLLAYFTDCAEVPEDAVEAARGVDTLVVDALRKAPHPTHMSVEMACDSARRIGPRRTFFTHMCHDLGHAETEANLPENIRLAYDGLRIEI
jgi:phosphoribosyl 1,2-cyclic phosphate phosphodiesterase